MGQSIVWDAAQYERFARERERPFHDLLARVPDGVVAAAADLGCGTGRLTRVLLERWPRARVYGVDNSPQMLERARDDGAPGLAFIEADLARWTPPEPLDRIVSNAALHWLPDHGALLARIAGWLAPGGVLAVQMPNNAAELPHSVLTSLLAEPAWRDRVPAGALAPGARDAAWYVGTLHDLGLEGDVWETTYLHRLPSPDAVIEWLRGTTLRPLLTALAPAVAAELVGALSARLTGAWRTTGAGIVFPFRRLFFVARRA
jgi:trans-aconitate 2-methyltransferase